MHADSYSDLSAKLAIALDVARFIDPAQIEVVDAILTRMEVAPELGWRPQEPHEIAEEDLPF